MFVHYFSPDGWEGCSLRGRPAIRDKMPVLIDEDLIRGRVWAEQPDSTLRHESPYRPTACGQGTPNQLRQEQRWTCLTLGYRMYPSSITGQYRRLIP